MSSRYEGGIVTATQPTPTQASASGVWTVKEAEYYQKAGNWPPGSGADPYFNYTTLLLHGDGTNGAQNNTFLDSSTNNFTITRNGNTTQGTFSPYVGPGNWSNYYDGSSSYISIPSNSLFDLGSSSFTIEAWIYPVSFTNGFAIASRYNNTPNGWVFRCVSSTTLRFVYGANIILDGTTNIPLNAWTHVAVVRNSSTITLYVNGTQVAQATGVANFTDATTSFQSGVSNTTTDYANGYISNLRIVKGSAVYTSAFTPSTKPIIATTQTTLLTSNANGFIDQSAANNIITRNGSAAVSKFSPFSLYQNVPTSYSGYFDGSGDYLSIANNTALTVGTGDFTIEAWVYGNTFATTNKTIWAQGNGGMAFYVALNTGRVGFEVYAGANIITSTATLSTNQWYHLAVTRSGTTVRLFINGALDTTATSSANFSSAAANNLGGDQNGAGNSWNGSISNFRLVKGQALYTSAFTPSTSPLTTTSQGATAANVSLLTCQSTTFVDNSTNAFTITANGDARPRVANPFTDTVTGPTPYATTTYGGSGYFDGSGDYLSIPNNTATTITTGDFTLEAWVYGYTFATSNKDIIVQGTGGFGWYVDYTNSKLTLGVYGGSSVLASTTALVANQWYHVAVTRSGTTVRMFINGALDASTTSSASFSTSSATNIGGDVSFSPGSWNGYISNFRLIKNTALYTAPFVPPSAPVTAVTNTQLLLNMTNGGIIDNTTVNDLETVGAAQVNTSIVKYGTGSMSFNGTTSYLTAPVNSGFYFGSGNFTIEAWVYTTSSAQQCIVFLSGTSTYGCRFEINGGGGRYLQVLLSLDGSTHALNYTANTGGISLNTWTHVALVRNGTTIYMFQDGIQVGVSQTLSGSLYQGSLNQIGTCSSANYMNGYIDDLRVTKGVARYTANFTPPTIAMPNF